MTMGLMYRENYWDSPELKAEFIRFLKRIFGLDLSEWDAMGFWDNRYRPFSYFDGDTVVANVCVYSMDMTVLGKPCHIAQISAVGTAPEYRRQGLNMQLMKKAVDWARDSHEFFFLFADREAYAFYQKCGFKPIDEYKSRLNVSGGVARPGAVQLDLSNRDNLDFVFKMASRREPVSDVLGVSNANLFMYWCWYWLRDHVWHIPDLQILILYKRDERVVTVYDIVGASVPEFREVYPYIREANDRTIEFLFMPDKLNPGDFEAAKTDANGTHVMGEFPLQGTHFIFPITAQA